jgi:glycosyltransferase involved in cell wall biosynthesis
VIITITIPVVTGKMLGDVLESINFQEYKNYEVIIINDRGIDLVSNIAKKYGAKEIIEHGSLLKARYIGAKASSGTHILQLDESRKLMNPCILKEIAKNEADAVFIREAENVFNFITEAAAIDKRISYSAVNIQRNKLYILPRLYRRDILMQSLESLKSKLGPLFDEITAPEDLLVYKEALPFIKKVEIIEEPFIMHYGDSKLREVVRKYYRYGSNVAMLSGTIYDGTSEFSILSRLDNRVGKGEKFRDLSMVILLWGIRYMAFKVGVLSQRMRTFYYGLRK